MDENQKQQILSAMGINPNTTPNGALQANQAPQGVQNQPQAQQGFHPVQPFTNPQFQQVPQNQAGQIPPQTQQQNQQISQQVTPEAIELARQKVLAANNLVQQKQAFLDMLGKYKIQTPEQLQAVISAATGKKQENAEEQASEENQFDTGDDYATEREAKLEKELKALKEGLLSVTNVQQRQLLGNQIREFLSKEENKNKYQLTSRMLDDVTVENIMKHMEVHYRNTGNPLPLENAVQNAEMQLKSLHGRITGGAEVKTPQQQDVLSQQSNPIGDLEVLKIPGLQKTTPQQTQQVFQQNQPQSQVPPVQTPQNPDNQLMQFPSMRTPDFLEDPNQTIKLPIGSHGSEVGNVLGQGQKLVNGPLPIGKARDATIMKGFQHLVNMSG